MKIKVVLLLSFTYIFITYSFAQVTIIAPPTLTGLCPGGNAQALGNIIIRETSLKDIDTTRLDPGRIKDHYKISVSPGFKFENPGHVDYIGSSIHNNNGSDITQPVLSFDELSIYFRYQINPSTPKSSWDTDIASFVWSGITVKADAGTNVGASANIIRTAILGGGIDANQIGNNVANAKVHATVQAGGFDVELIPDKTSICEQTAIRLTATPSTGTTYEFALRNGGGGWTTLTSTGNICNVSSGLMVNTGSADLDTTFRVRVTKDGCRMTTTTKVTIKPTPTANSLNQPGTYYTDSEPVNIPTIFPFTPPAGTIINGYSGSGVIGSTFYPATFTAAGSSDINYTLKSSPGGCVSNSARLAVITIQEEVSPPPAFLTTTNTMPFCESGGLQNATVKMCSNCVITSVTTIPALAKVSESGSGFTRNLQINPSINNNYSIKIKVNYTKFNGISFVAEIDSADISVYPTQTPSLNGLPVYYYSSKISEVPKMYSTSICKSNDSVRLFAFPVGSEIELYKAHQSQATSLAQHILIPMSSGLIADPNNDALLDSISFIPNEIHTQAMSGSSDSVLVVKVNNSSTSFCSGPVYWIVSFVNPYAKDIKMNLISQPPFCIGDSVEFNVTANTTQPSNGGWCGPNCKLYERYSWYYGDGKVSLSDTSRTIKHLYTSPGEFTMRFTAYRPIPAPQCPVDTVVKIIVGVEPKSEFFVKDNFAPNPIFIKNISSYNKGESTTTQDSISNWTWYMGDGVSMSSDKDTNGIYEYNHAGNPQPYQVYAISLVTTTDVGCKDSTTNHIPYFPTYAPTSTPYEEDFNTNSLGWFDKGQYQYPGDSSSWKNIVPDGVIINSAVYDKAWITSKLRTATDTAGYYKNENSWVESPVFDLNPLERPMISFDSWALSENQLDGTNLQYCLVDTIFGHEKWTTIGSPGAGFNWYNSGIIISKELPDNKFDAGWTGSTGDAWKTSSYYLDAVKDSSVGKLVRFRLSFTSNADNAPGIYDGFAFDNYLVGERNRMVLLEEFVNTSYTDPSVETTAVDPQALDIKYFVGHMGDDPVNLDNRADPSARSLLYGIDSLPRAVVDGIKFENKPFHKDFWGRDEYILRTLNVSPFDIVIDTVISGGKLTVTANIKKNSIKPVPGPFVVQIAMIEKSITVNSIPYRNVLRKLLPNAAGTRISDNSWAINSVHSVTEEWNPSVTPQDTIRAIAFIQDENTKEVYQAGFIDIPYARVQTLTKGPALKPSTPFIESSDFVIYPNPSSGNINIMLGEMYDQKVNWSILHNFGTTVMSGEIKEYIHVQEIATASLAPGIYTLRMEVNGEIKTKRFIITK